MSASGCTGRSPGSPGRQTLLFLGLALAPMLAAPGAPARDSALARYSLDESTITQWKLPKKLREVSGLAETAGRLFAHEDQSGIIYEIDPEGGRLVKAFALGKPTLRGDFEGIAFLAGLFYLVTSDGRLYAAREGSDGERVPYTVYDTDLGRRCEIEGLAALPASRKLILACKEARKKRFRDKLTLFVWSLDEERLLNEETLQVPLADIVPQLPGKEFNPSGVAVDRHTGHFIVIAARQRALVEIDPTGRVVQVVPLPLAARHAQTEGITFTADGRLILADEGAGKKARLSVYRPVS